MQDALPVQRGVPAIRVEIGTVDGAHLAVQQAGVEQLADQEGHAAGGVELVHVGRAVGIDAGQQRHRAGQLGEILEAQFDASGAGDGDEMQQVVGGATGGVQADHAVDDGALVDDQSNRRVFLAQIGDRRGAPHCGHG